MQRKKNISRILFVIALLFTIVFQFGHSLSHIQDFRNSTRLLEISVSDHHEDSGLDIEDELHLEHMIEKCFACDFILSSFVPSEHFSFEALAPYTVFGVQGFVIQKITPLNQVYFSLRAPPVFFI